MDTRDLLLFLPETYLFLTAIGLILGEVGYHGERVRMILATALLGVGGALLQLVVNYVAGAGRYGHGSFVNDGFGLFLKTLLLCSAGIALFADRKSHEVSLDARTEHAALILGSTALGMLAVSAVNWIWIWILLFATQVFGSLIFAMKKLDRRAIEASFKTNVSAFYAAILLGLAITFIFMATGEFDLYRIHDAILKNGISGRLFATAFSMMLVALGFFGTFFPAQLWAKDAYEGASLPATAFGATLFRITSFGVLARTLVVQFSRESDVKGFWIPITPMDWTPILAVVAGATLVMSALYAFSQNRTRKLLSGVLTLQSGYYLLGLLALDQVGFASVLFGLAAEVFMVGGLFASLSFFEDRRDETESRGHLSRSVPEGIALLAFLICVIGLPPLPGFISKFILIGAAARHEWNGLAGLALLALIISGVAVFRWIYPWIYELRHRNESFSLSLSHRLLLLGLVLPLALLTIFAEPMLHWVGASVAFSHW
jgi:NADH-quinone oxidoreductase subunit N